MSASQLSKGRGRGIVRRPNQQPGSQSPPAACDPVGEVKLLITTNKLHKSSSCFVFER